MSKLIDKNDMNLWFFRWCVKNHRNVVDEFMEEVKETMKELKVLAKIRDEHDNNQRKESV